MKPSCPECESNEIVEWNNVQVRYRIETVAVGDPASIGLLPEVYGVADVIWDTAEAVLDAPYQCRECLHEFDNFDHMVEQREMSIAEIKQAVDAGKVVKAGSDIYDVIKSKWGEYLIVCQPNGYTIGLHGKEGTAYESHLNGDGFYIKD